MLMPEYLKAMREHGSVTIPVSGRSMTPFVCHMRDTVTLVPYEGQKLKKGDIALYTRSGSGLTAYIMHRIVGFKDGCAVLCGDGQTVKEYGVRRESVLALASEVCRKGRTVKDGSPVWLFYKHIWRILRPLRPALIRVFSHKSR